MLCQQRAVTEGQAAAARESRCNEVPTPQDFKRPGFPFLRPSEGVTFTRAFTYLSSPSHNEANDRDLLCEALALGVGQARGEEVWDVRGGVHRWTSQRGCLSAKQTPTAARPQW